MENHNHRERSQSEGDDRGDDDQCDVQRNRRWRLNVVCQKWESLEVKRSKMLCTKFLYISQVSRDSTFVNGFHVIDIWHVLVALDVSEKSVLRRELLLILLEIPPALRNGDQDDHGPSSGGRIFHLRFVCRVPGFLRRGSDRSCCRTRRFRDVIHVAPAVINTCDWN